MTAYPFRLRCMSPIRYEQAKKEISMGMDIVCIIKNKLNESEILNIKSIVDSWTDIHKHVFNYREKGYCKMALS